jgi:hypothetical protein
VDGTWGKEGLRNGFAHAIELRLKLIQEFVQPAGHTILKIAKV